MLFRSVCVWEKATLKDFNHTYFVSFSLSLSLSLSLSRSLCSSHLDPVIVRKQQSAALATVLQPHSFDVGSVTKAQRWPVSEPSSNGCCVIRCVYCVFREVFLFVFFCFFFLGDLISEGSLQVEGFFCLFVLFF